MANMSSNEYILQTHDVVKRYKSLVALDRVSIRIRRGTIHGLLGENGAGKSTLVRLISGQTAPTEGRIVFDGEEVQGNDVKRMESLGVFLVTQELLGIRYEPAPDAPKWYEDVQAYDIFESDGSEAFARFYMDLYPRANKFGHAAA